MLNTFSNFFKSTADILKFAVVVFLRIFVIEEYENNWVVCFINSLRVFEK